MIAQHALDFRSRVRDSRPTSNSTSSTKVRIATFASAGAATASSRRPPYWICGRANTPAASENVTVSAPQHRRQHREIIMPP